MIGGFQGSLLAAGWPRLWVLASRTWLLIFQAMSQPALGKGNGRRRRRERLPSALALAAGRHLYGFRLAIGLGQERRANFGRNADALPDFDRDGVDRYGQAIEGGCHILDRQPQLAEYVHGWGLSG